MCVISKEGFILRINDTLCTMLGLSRDEVIGKRCEEIFQGSMCGTRQCPFVYFTQSGGQPFECDVELSGRGGKKIPCILTVTPLMGPDGTLTGIVEDFKDISQRKETQEALRKSEERYRTLVENSYDMIFVVDGEGNFLFTNTACERLLGYSQDELNQTNGFILMHPDDVDPVRQQLRKLMTEGTIQRNVEYRYRTKSGSYIHILTNGAPMFDDQGRVVAALCIGRDITELKRLEEERQKMQKLESLGILAGGIAHDFNNLLAAIISNLSLLETLFLGLGREDAIEMIKSAKAASWQARSLTQQLLTFARDGAPIKRAASISRLLIEAANLALSGSRVKSEFFLPDDLWWAEIDEGQISQVINNVIINARQAMPRGGTVRIWAENMVVGTLDADRGLPLPQGGRFVKISIQDQGPGIPQEYLQKIFDPYFTTKQGGIGLGLAISHSIIKKHNGYMSAESRPGAGATFHIYLPACELPADRKEASLAVRKIKELRSGSPRGRILVMEDRQSVRDMLENMLIDLGYEVELAQEGSEAVSLYEKARESGQGFDAVILDLTVPGGMGGKDAVGKLREIDPEVKAIVTSGYSTDPILANYRRYGFCAAISKPFEIGELGETLGQVLGDNERLKMGDNKW
ncbi:MAG: PAS domain S-box protein [bacterium]|nr:PAS domain S-box protein [bacterium]